MFPSLTFEGLDFMRRAATVNLMRTGWYLFWQSLLSSGYLVFRFTLAGDEINSLSNLEFNSFAILCVVLLIRLIRVESWLAYGIFAIKVTHVVMCGLMAMYRIYWAVVFGISAILVHFGVDPPFLEVSHRVATLTERIVQAYIETVPECLILFYASWESKCLAITPIFSEISEKYTMAGRLFGRFDIGRSARFQDTFHVSATNGTLNELPTIIHFKEGKEQKRLNPAIADGKPLNRALIVKHFKLTPPPEISDQLPACGKS
jgi:thiol-disulfide isomerase/thioredoxin